MTVYIDQVFLLNAGADALTLWLTARLTALPLSRGRLWGAAALGGLYGVLCRVPVLGFLAAAPVQLAAAAGLVYLAFPRRREFPRVLVLFWLLSWGLGGAFLALTQLLAERGAFLERLNWGVFLLAGGGCYLLLSLPFRGKARHAVAGELLEGRLERRGASVTLTVLLDTGHTLYDDALGAPVLVADGEALEGLWSAEEREVLRQLPSRGAAWCLQRLPTGRFRLLPYRAVGVSSGLLLCFCPDRAVLGGESVSPLTVALSPAGLGEGVAALWSGIRKGEKEDVG